MEILGVMMYKRKSTLFHRPCDHFFNFYNKVIKNYSSNKKIFTSKGDQEKNTERFYISQTLKYIIK